MQKAQIATALVTGGSRGIGRNIVKALAASGVRVAFTYHSNAEAAKGLVKEIRAANQGADVQAIQSDVASLAAHSTLVDSVIAAFGSLHLLVNNAGIAPRVRADLLETGTESFDAVLSTNLRGPFFLTQRVAKEMIARNAGERGYIVNIGSLSAYTSSINRAEYCVAKAGLAMMTQVFADRLARENILVYEVRPGIIETDMTGAVKAKYDKLFADGLTPINRWGQPDDVSKAVLAIAAGHLDYSTGEVINVDGGFHLRRL